jgi:phosphohistidine phosphatase SixA
MRHGVDGIVTVVPRLPRLICVIATIVCAEAAAHAQEAIYIVRHAERADRSANSPLSDAGAARARKLATMLKDAGVTHVFTSDLRRTIDTGAPLADALHTRAEQVPSGDAQALAAKITAVGLHDRVLVVGHSNTVPELLRALHVASPVTIADDEYDNLFIVVPKAAASPTLLRLKY